jgi:hypothetical protein
VPKRFFVTQQAIVLNKSPKSDMEVSKAGRTGRVFGSARVEFGPQKRHTELGLFSWTVAGFWLARLGLVQPKSSLFFFTKSKGPKGIVG